MIGITFFLTFLTTYCLAESSESTGTSSSDVVILTEANFEHETQASSGATTGDWLVEFYAPWSDYFFIFLTFFRCSHCKHLQPVWEELATALKGKVNVAKVDVTSNRALGTRFDIKGFPTIKFFRQGKIYDYSGRRTKDAFVTFVEGGYQSATSGEVPPMPTFIEQIQKSVTEPFLAAYQDVLKGRYTSPNVFLVAMPLFVVIVLTFAILVIPDADTPPKKQSSGKEGPKKD